MYWHNRDFKYKGDIFVFNTKTKKEEIFDHNTIFAKFPVPSPFGMMGTPFGHYSRYNVCIVSDRKKYDAILHNEYKCLETTQKDICSINSNNTLP